MLAFSCLSFGVSAAFSQKPERFIDFTFVGEEGEVKEKLERAGVMDKFKNFYQMEISLMPTFEGEHTFSNKENRMPEIRFSEKYFPVIDEG